MTDRSLHVVDEKTGELLAPGCRSCSDLAAKVACLEADLAVLGKDHVRALRRIDALLRDRDAEREADPQRKTIVGVFDYWRERCHHQNARFDGGRFDLIKGRLRQFTEAELRMAIDGAAVDPYIDAKGKRFDALGLILRDAEKVEDFCNRYARWKRRNGGQP